MSNKLIIAVAVALVVVVAAVGVYFVFGNDKATNDVTFLIQDNEGVYFWLEGNGETVEDALVDAFERYPSGTVTFSNSGGVKLFDIGTVNNGDGTYTYWIQFTWKDNKWTYNQLSMRNIKSVDVEHILVLHGTTVSMEAAIAPEGTPTPADVTIWNGNTNGVLFSIQSISGLYFKVNGSGNTVYDALENANSKYKMQFEGSNYSGEKDVKSIFGLEMVQVSDSEWNWWSTYQIESDDWAASLQYMSHLSASDNPQICIIYTDGTNEPTVPIAKG